MMKDCDGVVLEEGLRVACQMKRYKELRPMIIHSFTDMRVRVATEENPGIVYRFVEPHRLAVLFDQGECHVQN